MGSPPLWMPCLLNGTDPTHQRQAPGLVQPMGWVPASGRSAAIQPLLFGVWNRDKLVITLTAKPDVAPSMIADADCRVGRVGERPPAHAAVIVRRNAPSCVSLLASRPMLTLPCLRATPVHLVADVSPLPLVSVDGDCVVRVHTPNASVSHRRKRKVEREQRVRVSATRSTQKRCACSSPAILLGDSGLLVDPWTPHHGTLHRCEGGWQSLAD